MKRILCLFLAKKATVILCIFSLLIHEQLSFAQALPAPAANFVMNRAVAGIVTRVAAARGFAANDPRLIATLGAVSSQMTAVNVASTVAGVGLTIAGAPVWLTVAAGLGVLAVGAALVAGTTKIEIVSGGNSPQLKVTPTPPVGPSYSPLSLPYTDPWSLSASQGVPIYRTASCQSSDQWCSSFPAVPLDGAKNFSVSGGSVVAIASTLNQLETFRRNQVRNGLPFGVEITDVKIYWEPNANGDNVVLKSVVSGTDNGTPFSTVSDESAVIGPNIKPIVSSSLDGIWSQMSGELTDERLSDETLAALVNSAWSRGASSTGYEGLPYSYLEPVTASDVAQWRAENVDPFSNPTIGDLLAPASDTGLAYVPIGNGIYPGTGNPGGNPNPDPNPDPNQNTNVDLGPDPGIGPPTLEATPTAEMILSPLLNLMPDLRHFVVPQHTAECPRPAFDVFEKHIVIESHCDVIEYVRPTLYAVMAVVWAAVAILIILSA